VIPASGFYEWQAAGRERLPWLFRRPDESAFGLAGIWDRWIAADGTPVESCAVITSQPNETMRPIHHRMPAMLAPEHFERWLDPRVTDVREFAELLQPAPARAIVALPVSTHVSDVRHEGPECLAPREPGAPARPEPQMSLGL
jgi:putative SOS response-associated peptidase YedK